MLDALLGVTAELWIERDDFEETPPKGYFRLSPGSEVRLRYGYVVRCTGFDKDASGAVVAVHCEYLPETKSGTPGADSRKVKGNIHDLNPSSKTVITAQCEPGLDGAAPEQRFQFERHGYFVADRVDSRPGTPVFNRAVTLKESWASRG